MVYLRHFHTLPWFAVNFGSPAVPLDWWFGSHVAIVQPNGGDNKKGN
jgi:hypothetical protein